MPLQGHIPGRKEIPFRSYTLDGGANGELLHLPVTFQIMPKFLGAFISLSANTFSNSFCINTSSILVPWEHDNPSLFLQMEWKLLHTFPQ